MKHLKRFENFNPINEEEGIFGKVGASVGMFNKDAIEKAQSKLENPSPSFKPKDLVKKKEEFKNHKSAYEKDPKSEDGLIFKDMVKHINLNNDAVWKIEVGNDGRKKLIPGMTYGSRGGTAASAGGASK